MKAIVLTRFGPPDVLQLKEVPTPAPKDNEVLIRIHATTVSAGDYELRGLHIPVAYQVPIRLYVGLIRPKPFILGQELAGAIEAAGQAVTRFRPGDHVVGWTGLALGAYAEYICLPETGVLAPKPPTLTYAEAAPLAVGGLEAVYFMQRGNIQPGQKVLVYGAGGSIGTFAIQLAKHFGADVTGVDRATKLDMLRSIGADHVMDYTREDFTRNNETYDVIFDVIGKSSFSRGMRSLSRNGRYLMGNPRLSHRLRAPWMSTTSGKHVTAWAARSAAEYAADFRFLTELVETGKIKPVIDRRYALEQMADAHRYVETGQKQGNVVITVGHSSAMKKGQ
jgi:NADPH:quinone reductase-like Zn-dependent oxidoreductase